MIDKVVFKIVTRSILLIFTLGDNRLSFLDDPAYVDRGTGGEAAGYEHDKKGDNVPADVVFVSDLCALRIESSDSRVSGCIAPAASWRGKRSGNITTTVHMGKY